MKKRAVMMLSLAILIALSVTLVTYNWLQEKTTVLRSLETQSVMISESDLAWGTVITREMLKPAPYLKSSLPNGYFTDAASLQGRTLLFPIKANEPIFESRLAPKNTQGGITAIIAPKKRAMAVKVDKVVGVSGFVHPGNRVDVLVSLSQRGNITAPITKTVIENVLVLAAGTEMDKTNKDKPSPVDVITLEVTPEEGERLALAATEGRLQLSLRNGSDTAEVLTRGTTIPMLLTSHKLGTERVEAKKIVKARAPVPSVSAPIPLKVELIQGTKLIEVKYQ